MIRSLPFFPLLFVAALISFEPILVSAQRSICDPPCGINALCEGDPDGGTSNTFCVCEGGFEIGDPLVECFQDCDSANCDDNFGSCRNFPDGFRCFCDSGFDLAPNNRDCLDIDECASPNLNDCHPDATCTNFDGGWFCECNDGFVGDGQNCALPDPCRPEANPCGVNAECNSDSNNEAICTCPFGFEGDPEVECEEIDPCDPNPCGIQADCAAENFAPVCSCPSGFIGDELVECFDDPCDPFPCGTSAVCTVSDKDAVCTCPPNFLGDPDVECVPDPCVPFPCAPNGAECFAINNLQDFQCSCINGYEGDPEVACTEVDECADPTLNNCDDNADCINTDGSFECVCQDGFFGDGVNCQNIDFCGDPGLNTCHPNAICQPRRNGFTCDCDVGYDGDGFNCNDINECETGVDNCHPRATCTNTQGGFSCQCDVGLVDVLGDGSDCQLPDPCTAGNSNPCGILADCTASANGEEPVCTCPMGFEGDPDVECTEIDPCDDDPCGIGADCTASPTGKPVCRCPDGLVGNPLVRCLEPDPCDSITCGTGANCITILSVIPTCVCPFGTEGNPFVACTEINPCDPNPCGTGAVCTAASNLDADCTCPDGFEGNPDIECVPEPEEPEPDPGMVDDPHIVAWNHTMFDYHGECDLVLVDAPHFGGGQGLTIHVRTKIRYDYSFIETAALRIGGGDDDGDLNLQVGSWADYAVNGVSDASLDEFPMIFHSQLNKKHHTFTVELSPTTNITLSTFKDWVSVKIHGALRDDFGDSSGIMGSFEGGKLLARDGVTEMDDLIEFGQEWQVKADEPMLFQSSREPEAPNRCILPTDQKMGASQIQRLRRRLDENSVSWEEAVSACGFLSEASRKEACIHDVLRIGDVDLAQAGAY